MSVDNENAEEYLLKENDIVLQEQVIAQEIIFL